MKIGLICPYNIFRGGGVQECVRAMQVELNKRGHKVIILTPQPRENLISPKGTIFLGGATEVKSLFHTTSQISVIVNSDAIRAVLSTEDFDILHFHEPWVPMLSRQILMESKSRTVATFHAKLPETVMARTIERVITPYTRSILKYFDGMTAVSDAAAEYVRSLTSEPIQIVPNGIDLQRYRAPGKITSLPLSILYIGRLERRKGLKYLLRAYALLADRLPHVQLIIAGDGPDRKILTESIHEHGLKRVRLLGHVSEAKKIQLLHSASLFCSPAPYGESFGIVLLEAMAAGLPVVAADNPGYRSVLGGRGALSLVNPKDTVAFTRQLELLLTDQSLRSSWKEWATQNIDQYDYPKVINHYEALYNQLLTTK